MRRGRVGRVWDGSYCVMRAGMGEEVSKRSERCRRIMNCPALLKLGYLRSKQFTRR
jgi:hypothetical protein